jgi:acyl carrier protein
MKENQLRKIITAALQALAPEVDLSVIPPDVDLRKELDIDSFDYLNLMIALNEKLGVDIPESDYAKLTTLSGMLTYLAARLTGS